MSRDAITPDRAMEIARAVLAGGARGVELRELAEWVIERLEQLRAEANEADRLREGIERLVELLEPDTDIRRCHWVEAYDAVSDIVDRLCELLNAEGPHDDSGDYDEREET